MCYDHYYVDYAMKIWLLYFGWLYFVLGDFFGILTGGGQTN